MLRMMWRTPHDSCHSAPLNHPDPTMPLGLVGVGEVGITGPAAATANALHHATGRRVRDLPITLDKLLWRRRPSQIPALQMIKRPGGPDTVSERVALVERVLGAGRKRRGCSRAWVWRR
jgi:hypothetical protein